MITSEQLRQEIYLKKEKQDRLQESMSSPERKYVKIKDAVRYVETQLPAVLAGGDERRIKSLQEAIQKNRESLQDILDGRAIAESDPRVMSIREKREMHTHSVAEDDEFKEFQQKNNIKYVTLRDRDLVRDIIPIKDEVLNQVLTSPKVKEYQDLNDTIKKLEEEYDVTYKQETEDWKQEQESKVKSLLDALTAAWEKAYIKLVDVSKKKDDMIAQLGMHEKAALEALSPSERYKIEKEEERVGEIERAQKKISILYDALKQSKDRSNINDMMSRIKRMSQQYKERFGQYRTLADLALLFTIN